MSKNYIKKLLVFIICIVIVFVTLFPIYWLMISSFRPEKELFTPPPTLILKRATFENFENALNRTNFHIYFRNTAFITTIVFFLAIMVGSLAAYAISRFKFAGRTTFFFLIIMSQVLPITTLIIPLYVLWGRYNLLNTYFSLIATYCAIISPVTTWLLTGYFNSIPKEIDESAIIDGCSSIGVLFKIILPLAKPGLAAAGISIIMTVWQELMLAITFTTDDNMRTLMAGVTSFITRSGIKWGSLNAAGVLVSIPVFIIYIFFQKAFIRGLTDGAVKG